MARTIEERPVEAVLDKVHALVDRYRGRCLWFLATDYYPQTRAEVLRILGDLERRGDREAFSAAASIRQWLSPTSNDTSAGS
ncbi:hypothetical protein BH24ACI5_BH24ACI5_16830 [soil metagenome]